MTKNKDIDECVLGYEVDWNKNIEIIVKHPANSDYLKLSRDVKAGEVVTYQTYFMRMDDKVMYIKLLKDVKKEDRLSMCKPLLEDNKH